MAKGAEPDSPAGRRALIGTVALGVANSARLGLQLLVLPVLARILGPEAFGIVALAMPFILFATMLSDGGMGNALIRQREPSRHVESTVFWLSVGLGLFLVAAICALAVPMGRMLGQPGFPPILMAMSPILMLSSMLSVANARIARARRFGVFAVGDSLSAVLSAAAAILAALNGWGAWSLVVQQLVLWIAKAAWIMPVSRFRPLLACRPREARELLSFGLHNVGAQVADFAGKSVPALLIGASLGVVAVGHYSMAYQLVRIPDLVLSGPLYLATFTALSALAPGMRPQAAALSLRTVRLVVLATAPLFCGLALTADLLVATLLGPKWDGTAPVLVALAAAGFFICLYNVLGAVLMGLGRADLQFRLSLLVGSAMILGALAGRLYGLAAAGAGVSLGIAAVFPVYAAILSRQLGVGLDALGGIGRPLAATALMALAVVGVRHGAASLDPMSRLAACIACGVAVFAGALWVISRRQVLEDVRTILARPSSTADAR